MKQLCFSMLFAASVVFVNSKTICDSHLDPKHYFGQEPNCGEGQCICIGNTANCTGGTTSQSLPLITENVTRIFASCYNLYNLTRNSFENLRHLSVREMFLVQNFVYNFTKDVFSDLTDLRVLKIGENINLNMNRTAMYVALGSLQKELPLNLTIERAGIRLLNPNVVRNLSGSKVISLSLPNNKIKYIYLHVVGYLKHLKTFNLSTNRLESIRGNSSAESLLELDLNRNRLHQKGLRFCYLLGMKKIPFFPNLQKLFISNNYVKTEAKRFSKIWQCLDKLELLDLSNNTLREINMSSFSNLTSLKTLSLASNWIENITPAKLPPKLKTLDFYDNHFVTFPPDLCKGLKNTTFPSVKAINFGRNYIQKLRANCACFPGIETLDFSRNDVSIIENGTFSRCDNLKNLNVAEMIPDAKVFQSAAFFSVSLVNLNMQKNGIDFSKHDHRRLFNFCRNLTLLDISYNDVEGLSFQSVTGMLTPLKKLENLIMKGVNLQQFPVGLLNNLPELKMLNIDDNLLHGIKPNYSSFIASLDLKVSNISIADNFITTVTEDDFSLYQFKSLKYLNLGDNEFLCDCQMEWFRDRINTSGYIGGAQLTDWPENYICRSPPTLQGHTFNDFEPDTICKPMDPLVFSLIAIASFLVVFTLVASIVYCYRWHLRYLSYKISKRRQGSNDQLREPLIDQTHFDAFVVSNSDDDEFVHHPFLELMEEKMNYKLHVWKRDAQNGSRVDVVLDAMYASNNIVVIVSNNLLKDNWCRFQVDVALDISVQRAQNCVMLVVLDDVDFKPVSKSWCVLLTKTSTAYWTNDVDSIKYRLFKETVKQHFGDPISQQNNTIN